MIVGLTRKLLALTVIEAVGSLMCSKSFTREKIEIAGTANTLTTSDFAKLTATKSFLITKEPVA